MRRQLFALQSTAKMCATALINVATIYISQMIFIDNTMYGDEIQLIARLSLSLSPLYGQISLARSHSLTH